MNSLPYKVVDFSENGTPSVIARCARLDDALAIARRYLNTIVRNPLVDVGEPMVWDRFGNVAETRWR